MRTRPEHLLLLMICAQLYHITSIGQNKADSLFELRLTLASGLAQHKAYNEALQVMEQACRDTVGLPVNLYKTSQINRIRYDILKGLGQYKEATVYADAFIANKDSLHKTEQGMLALQFNEQLKKAEYSRQLAEKELKISRQRTTMQILIISGVALLIIGLMLFIYQRKKNEAQHRLLITRQKEQELKAAEALLDVQLKERQRISKEIHDDLGSSMTSISLITEVLKRKLDRNAYPELDRMSAATTEAVDKINEIVWSLNTNNDSLHSLIAHTRKACGNLLQYTPAELEFTTTGIGKDIPVSGVVRRNIYLAVKEAINNAVKHSGASRVSIEIIASASMLDIFVRDNGVGMQKKTTIDSGYGLQNMRDRMEEIGGQFNLSGNNGTVVHFSSPLKKAV